MKHLLLLTLFCLPTAQLIAQPPPGISENPDGAVRLRTLWVKTGSGRLETSVGYSAVGLGDINRDDYDDFSVRVGWQHWIFLGGAPISDVPVQILDSTGYGDVKDPVVGDFLGDGKRLYGYLQPKQDPNNQIWYLRMPFFRYDPDSHMVVTDHLLSLQVQMSSTQFHSADLDGDGDDELVFVNREGRDAVVRIYEGGPDFSLDVPTREIRVVDTVASTGSALSFYSSIADFDSDQHLDLKIGKFNADASSGEQEVWLWWGGDTAFRQWGNVPDRLIASLPLDIAPFPIYASFAEDLDGDGAAEIFARVRVGEDEGSYLWLTRNRESTRTRSFTRETYDRFYPKVIRNRGFGYVADSLQRYEMMTLLGERDAYGLGGGQYGPNDTYDAHFGGGDGPAFGGVDGGDVNGDGWRDRLIASSTYGGPGVGRAVIVAGGPYIPVDDPTVSVQSAPVAGEPSALHLWPNPVVDNLHIAWRGDLPRMPHLMRIYDVRGQLIEERGLPTWKGTTTWSAAAHPAGAYTIVIFDAENRQLGIIPFVLQP